MTNVEGNSINNRAEYELNKDDGVKTIISIDSPRIIVVENIGDAGKVEVMPQGKSATALSKGQFYIFETQRLDIQVCDTDTAKIAVEINPSRAWT